MPLYQSGSFPVPASGSLGWSDALFVREAANTIAQRNGTSPQTFNLYNTYTDASNYEGLQFTWSANIAMIKTIAAGSGSLRSIRFDNGGGAITYSTTGNLTVSGSVLFSPDLTTSVGAVGATRPLAVYAGYYAANITSQSGTSYTAATSDSTIIFTSASTVTLTLPSAASFTGRQFHLKGTGGGAVNSATSNVVPLAGGAASTGILAASAGKFAILQSDGSNWVIIAAN